MHACDEDGCARPSGHLGGHTPWPHPSTWDFDNDRAAVKQRHIEEATARTQLRDPDLMLAEMMAAQRVEDSKARDRYRHAFPSDSDIALCGRIKTGRDAPSSSPYCPICTIESGRRSWIAR